MFCDSDFAPVRRCNVAPLSYLESHRYRDSDVNEICAVLDDKVLAARITFFGNGEANITVSRKLYEVKGGHVPAVGMFFMAAAKHPILDGQKGSIILWLEDGFWTWYQDFAKSAPILSFGRHVSDTRSFLIPDPAFMHSVAYKRELEKLRAHEHNWPFDKKEKVAFFRGAASGCGIEGPDWAESPRGRLVKYGTELNQPEKIDAKFTRVSHLEPEQRKLFTDLNFIDSEIPFHDFLRYRYLINVDGYCCAWVSMFTKLSSSSLLINVESDYRQWYYEDLVPWRHFVPVKKDLSDFLELYDWISNNDGQVQNIVSNANNAMSEITFNNSVEEVALLCHSILECRDE